MHRHRHKQNLKRKLKLKIKHSEPKLWCGMWYDSKDTVKIRIACGVVFSTEGHKK